MEKLINCKCKRAFVFENDKCLYCLLGNVQEIERVTYKGKEIILYRTIPSGFYCSNLEPQAKYGYPSDGIEQAKKIINKARAE